MVDQAVMDCVECEFQAVGDAELVKDVVKVILDGLLGDKKFFADFLVAKSLSDQLNDLLFAVGEQRFFTARAGFG